ncbi:MAG: Triosephosphate isomerase [Myxococcaceae bacterium]|nr:Triosephosphate isomerase [Myxococcaceae bacterium]
MNKARKPLIAGNWKMFHGGLSGLTLAAQIAELAKRVPRCDLVIAPPFTVIAAAAAECEGSGVALAGQNLHTETAGAFTGEISGVMLKESGCSWVIVGHSERRQLFGEDDKLVSEKTRAALDAGLLPIVCVGETLAEREKGETLAIVERQVDAFLDVLALADLSAAIAYEPVWAIGTGKTAGPAEAEEVHAAIRKMLANRSDDLALHTRILYGGSVKASNASAIFAAPNVDGALIGGASLEAGSFGAIADAAEARYNETPS